MKADIDSIVKIPQVSPGDKHTSKPVVTKPKFKGNKEMHKKVHEGDAAAHVVANKRLKAKTVEHSGSEKAHDRLGKLHKHDLKRSKGSR